MCIADIKHIPPPNLQHNKNRSTQHTHQIFNIQYSIFNIQYSINDKS
ncbi:hypothetical protein SEHO0A_01881 [Salmonella enterica subsp. houtenae str. ATCC BAA-1581]|nr:hypothetical protein SEHO0A_01881 [Salmonella enterica subsp. houtenae str. ATCC BAA-1581]